MPWAALAIVFCSGCATTRLDAFADFAQAGTAYASAAEAVLDEAAIAAVDADSAVLSQARALMRDAQAAQKGEALRAQRKLDRDALTTELSAHNLRLREHLALLGDIADHANLLEDYFLRVLALADARASAATADAAGDAAKSLAGLSKRIREAQIGDSRVIDLVQPLTGMIVASFQRAALDAELTARSSTIALAIELERAALEAIGTELAADEKVLARVIERENVLDPFRDTAKALPKSWPKNRRALLMSNSTKDAVRAAESAASKLRTSFIALVENRLDRGDLTSLLADADRALALGAGIKGQR